MRVAEGYKLREEEILLAKIYLPANCITFNEDLESKVGKLEVLDEGLTKQNEESKSQSKKLRQFDCNYCLLFRLWFKLEKARKFIIIKVS